MPRPLAIRRQSVTQVSVSAILRGSRASYERPHLVSVKRSIRSERPEVVLFERSEFTDDSERRMLSSEPDAALIFWLLFYQEKSNIQI